jgi:U4/U6.U5 tri-snRNP-associated protein 1
MVDTISIEETNRIRVSLGMKPLPVPGAGPVFKDESASDSDSEEASTLETREAQGTANWQRVQDEAERKRQKEARNEAIRKARDKAKRFEKLEGKGLGDADYDELDTKTWLLQQKKRQKRLEKERARAKKLEEELRQREEAAYTANDLSGVRVGHQASKFDETGGEQVLTLKDATIDEYEEEGDELENVDLRENERRAERLDLLKKKPAYDPNADEDDEEDRAVLKQYDEVIDGRKRKHFTLGAQGMATEADTGKRPSERDPKRQAISLDILKDVVTSDYQEPKEISFKKPKKSKKKSTRQKVFDDDDILPVSSKSDEAQQGDTMDVATGAAAPPRPTESFIDDDDLQASLARTRKEALKKRKKLSAKDIAAQIQEALPEEPERVSDEEPGLVIDETSEFVANLRPEEIEAKPKRESPSKDSPAPKVKHDSDEDVDMAESYNDVHDHEPSEERKPDARQLTETGLDADAPLTQGIGSALRLLHQRGMVEKKDNKSLTTRYQDQQLFINEKRRVEEAAQLRARQQRERDRQSGKLDRMSAREREEYARRENNHRDQFESRQMGEIFDRNYKPDVNITHTDEHGRSLSQKEAFKDLSHQFHGKGSGKQKTEKRLKKIEDEKRKAAENVIGTGQTSGLNKALGSTAKKNKQAGVRMG